jgi:hypothetical protein
MAAASKACAWVSNTDVAMSIAGAIRIGLSLRALKPDG